MKAVILAGGLGTRLAEETSVRPKPMVEIGGKPLLWHILKLYSAHGINEFIVCCGYKGYLIKEYFANYFLHVSDVTFDIASNTMQVHEQYAEQWKVTLVDTGEHTMTGGRLKRIRQYIGTNDFCFTYGDGVGNIDIRRSIKFHKAHGKLATVTAVQPPGRFGALGLKNNIVKSFVEKPNGDGMYVNGGFFVLNPKVIDFIEGDETIWEREPLETLALNGEIQAFKHDGFWQPMDTYREVIELNELWNSNRAPWKNW